MPRLCSTMEIGDKKQVLDKRGGDKKFWYEGPGS